MSEKKPEKKSEKKQISKIIQIELNEISKIILDPLIAQGRLPNFARIQRDWIYLDTESEHEYQKIEPWIQWTTAHTGKSFSEHGIFRLSDATRLKHEQIWEVLSKVKIESAIVGSMNGIRRNTQGGVFFPDPWAQQNDAYPENLKPLWKLISSKVQSHATAQITISDLWNGFCACLSLRLPLRLYFKIAIQLVSQKFQPKNKWRLAVLFDEFLSEIFKSILKRTDFGFYTLFLNANAHYQHHYWRNFDQKGFDPSLNSPDVERSTDPIAEGYQVYDRILGEILKLYEDRDDVLFVIATGLSQLPFIEQESQGGMNYYRLNDHRTFLASIGFSGVPVFPLMSRDWQVQYRTEEEKESLLRVLGGFTVGGKPVFRLSQNENKFIFIETAYTSGVSAGSQIFNSVLSKSFDFSALFTNIALKSGHHSGDGHLWLSSSLNGFEKERKKINLAELYQIPQKVFLETQK